MDSFNKNTVKHLFSQKWQHKEEGYKLMTKELKLLLDKQNTSIQQTDSGNHMISFKDNKHDCLKLVANSVERGLNDKIMHVKLQA